MPVQWGRDALDDLAARGFTRRHVLRVAALVSAARRPSARLGARARTALRRRRAPRRRGEDQRQRVSRGTLGAGARGAGRGRAAGQPLPVPGDRGAGGDRRGARGTGTRALRGVPGLEPGAAPRGDRVHVADARARRRRAGLRGGRRRRDVHRRARGARAAARGRGPRPAGDAGGVQEATGRAVLRVQPEQPDRHGDAARGRSTRWWPPRRATPWSCSTRRTSTCATSRAASIWCARARTWSCCARSRRSSAWPACAPGFAIARKDLLARMTPWNTGAMPATAMAAAHAALGEHRAHRGAQARQRRAPHRPDALLRRARLPLHAVGRQPPDGGRTHAHAGGDRRR